MSRYVKEFLPSRIPNTDQLEQAKVNNQGIAALAYSQLLRPGVTFGLGASIDTQRLSESAHKVSRCDSSSTERSELTICTGRSELRFRGLNAPNPM